MQIVLASASPRRRELMEMLGVRDLKIIPAGGEECAPEGLGPEELREYHVPLTRNKPVRHESVPLRMYLDRGTVREVKR